MKKFHVILRIKFLALTLVACASTPRGPLGEGRKTASLEDICPVQHTDASGLAVCDQLFPSRPFVRPPADNSSNSSALDFYAGIYDLGYFGIYLVDRNGTKYGVVDQSKKSVDLKHLPKSIGMPSYSYIFTLYHVKGAVVGRDSDKNPLITVGSIVPAAKIMGCAIDNAFLGTWTGSMTARKPDLTFDIGKTVPIEVIFTTLKKESNLVVYPNKTSVMQDPEATVHGLVGNLQNMAAIPSNPFRGASNPSIEIWRVAQMHEAGDTHTGILYPSGMANHPSLGMGELTPFLPAALIQVRPSKEFSEVEFQPHGPVIPGISHIWLAPSQIGRQSQECQ